MFTPRAVIWSADGPLPEAAFAGYGWQGADLLIGDGDAPPEGRLPGLWDDGCHLTCRRDRDGHLIATDPRRAMRLFLYRAGRRRWAASNSFSALVDHVAARGWTVTIDLPALRGWRLPETQFDSPPFPQTAAARIVLLTSWQVLRVGPDGEARIESRPAAVTPRAETLDAQLSAWLGRLLTLLCRPGGRMALELTGGLDSRTCLAMLLHLRDSGRLPASADLSVVSFRGKPDDLAVARHLCATYGLPLNPPSGPGAFPVAADWRIAVWRDFALGIGAFPNLPAASFDPVQAVVGGQGGEFLRRNDWAIDLPDLTRRGAAIPGALSRLRWRRRLGLAWREAQGRLNPAGSPAEQYRWAWRTTSIAGHLSQMSLRVTPLAGMGLAGWLLDQPASWLEGGRVLYTMIERLAPGLSRHAFAGDGYLVPDGLPAGGPPLPAGPGRVIAAPRAGVAPPPATAATASVGGLLSLALDRAEAAGAARVVGSDVVAAARASLAAVGPAAMPDRVALRSVHLTLLAGLLAEARMQSGSRRR